MKKFLNNFIISFLCFVIIDLLGIVIRPIVSENGTLYNIMLDMDDWEQTLSAIVLIICTIGIPFALYFFLGTKLKPLGRHVLNYLSTSGSLVLILLFVLFTKADFENKLMWDINASYGLFAPIYILNLLNNNIIGAIVMAILPSLNIWLGMLWESKNRNKQGG